MKRYFYYMLLLFGLVVASPACKIKNLINKHLEVYDTDFKVNLRMIHQEGLPSTLVVQGFAKKYKITIRAYTSNKTSDLIFTTTYNIDGIIGEFRYLELEINELRYWLEVECVNTERNQTFNDLILVNKSLTNEQTIVVEDSIQNPLMNSYIRVGDQIRVRHSKLSTAYLYLKYFPIRSKPASPPHLRQKQEFNPRSRPREMLKVPRNQYVRLEKEGLYFIQTDSLSTQGTFLTCFSREFPKMLTLNELIEATRYITRDIEYSRLKGRGDRKKELEEFWLQRAGTKQRAKSLIREYYGRTQEANEYFSTYKEGWKTDRGIIYTVFGPPNRRQKTAKYEYWFYQGTDRRQTAEFFFDIKDNQYLLRRSPYLETYWKAQIHEWRNGLIYERD